ncbi:MAG: hypothetical protein IT378_12285 [Sandaracinaceae bacterium]|nr:hypothetical protein [Sandaracinaceae bacterium]
MLSQATSTKRPKIVAASSYFNGQITHSFTTGSQQYVQSATGATLVSQRNTIYAVCRAANVASTRVVCASNNASAAQQLYYSTTPDWKLSARRHFDGEIAEILVYEGAHSAATRALLASYYNRRYGLSITT